MWDLIISVIYRHSVMSSLSAIRLQKHILG
jgi:hypothetical protein